MTANSRDSSAAILDEKLWSFLSTWIDTEIYQKKTVYITRAATVQICFGSVLIFDAGFRLFRFGSSNCTV